MNLATKKETTQMTLAAKITPLLHSRAILVILHYVRRTETNMSTVVVISNGVQRGWRGPLSRSLSLLPSLSLSLSRPLSFTLSLSVSHTHTLTAGLAECVRTLQGESGLDVQDRSSPPFMPFYLHILKYTRRYTTLGRFLKEPSSLLVRPHQKPRVERYKSPCRVSRSWMFKTGHDSQA